jgi:hypothetical protein
MMAFDVKTFDVHKFDKILSRGLSSGLGSRDGSMCIEAAICCVLDLPHGDDPKCVAESVRQFKISLNDKNWSSPEARASGLRNLGLAQLGSLGVVSDVNFVSRLAEKLTRVLIPKLFRQVFPGNAKLLALAAACESQGTQISAAAAARAARAYAAAAYAAYAAAAYAAYAAAAYAAAAAAAAYAARAAARAAYAARAAARAAYAARAYAAADAAADAAYAARAAAYADGYLILAADLALDVLQELNSPGCELISK